MLLRAHKTSQEQTKIRAHFEEYTLQPLSQKLLSPKSETFREVGPRGYTFVTTDKAVAFFVTWASTCLLRDTTEWVARPCVLGMDPGGPL